MTLPRVATTNYLNYGNPLVPTISNSDIQAFSSELSAPQDFLRNQWPKKRWHSPHTIVEIITNQNNKIRFHYGGSNFTATLAAGVYRWGNLMIESANAMNLAASVSTIRAEYNKATGKPRLWRTGGSAFNLLCESATGTDKQRSAYPTLGYDCTTDKTGAAADDGYISDLVTRSSYGRFQIYPAGSRQCNKIYYDDGSPQVATITTAVYNMKSLFSEMAYQMCQESGVDDIAWFLNESTMRIHLKSGTLTITLDTGTGDLLPSLGGFTTAVADTEHTALNQAIHNYEVIDIVLSDAQQLDIFAMIGHNFTEDVVSFLFANTSNAWDTPLFGYFFQYAPQFMYKFPDLPHNGGIITAPFYKYYRIEISDPKNPDKFVSLGIPWGGPYKVLSHNFNFGGADSRESKSQKGKTDSSNTIGNRKDPVHNIKCPFTTLEDSDRLKLIEDFKKIDILTPAIWAMLPEDDTWTIYGTLARNSVDFVTRLTNKWDSTIEIEEEL